jgi:hypothetical protein
MLIVCLLAGTAAADSDNRPQDRFAFALFASAATSRTLMGVPSTGPSPAGLGWETSYWPNDYLGFDYDFELLHIAGPPSMGDSINTGAGMSGFVAVPLRYIQPYAGVWGGVRYNFREYDSRGANLTWAPRAGVNVYINRNLRLFGQWERISLEDDTPEESTVLSFGARWSPDVFHRQRGATKFGAVWSFAAMSFGLWALASIVTGNQN